jgi:hypothetical protein
MLSSQKSRTVREIRAARRLQQKMPRPRSERHSISTNAGQRMLIRWLRPIGEFNFSIFFSTHDRARSHGGLGRLPPGQLGRVSRTWVRELCRDLCRNWPIPAGIVRYRLVSLRNKECTSTSSKSRVDSDPHYYSAFFSVASPRTGSRIRNDEVVGSIPTSSTNHLNHLSSQQVDSWSKIRPLIGPARDQTFSVRRERIA